MTDFERRAHEGVVEFRAAPDGSESPGTLVGYACVFNTLSRDLGGWYEVIDAGSVGPTLEGGLLDLERHVRVICRTNHDSNLLLGTTDAGTLRIYVDEIGIRYEVDLPNTTAGRDAAVLAARGDFRFSSFAFRTMPDECEWLYDYDDKLVRRVLAMRLVDVAPVADPAYWGSSVGLRDFDLDAIKASLRSDQPDESLPAASRDMSAYLNKVREIRSTYKKGGR